MAQIACAALRAMTQPLATYASGETLGPRRFAVDGRYRLNSRCAPPASIDPITVDAPSHSAVRPLERPPQGNAAVTKAARLMGCPCA